MSVSQMHACGGVASPSWAPNTWNGTVAGTGGQAERSTAGPVGHVARNTVGQAQARADLIHGPRLVLQQLRGSRRRVDRQVQDAAAAAVSEAPL